MSKLVLAIGLIGLCHAAYSATQHRNYLRLTESEFNSLPSDILAETLFSLLACCFGIISISTRFKPIQITSEWESKTWDNIANRTSFYSFNHRGKYLFTEGSISKANAADLVREFLPTRVERTMTERERREQQSELNRRRIAETHQQELSSSETQSDEHEDADEENSSDQ